MCTCVSAIWNGEVTDLLLALQPDLEGKARWRQLEGGRLPGKVSGRDGIHGRPEEPP